ncbi:MAG: signal peptidase I [Candidatus Methanomethylicaceae archaeon]
MSKDSKFFLKALFVFLIFIFGFSGVARAVSGTNMPFAAVMSGSMEPTIPTGSLLFIQKVSGEEIVAGDRPVGDVIVFYFPETKITDYFLFAVYDPVPWSHRAIDKEEINGKYYILTKGDANAYPDENPYNPRSWVPEDRVIGKVVWYVPYLGYHMDKEPPGSFGDIASLDYIDNIALQILSFWFFRSETKKLYK